MRRIHYYFIALIGFFGLFILLMLWNTILFPSTSFPIATVLFLVVTPLLLPFVGLLNGNVKSCIWMGYISLFYFIHGITEFYTTPTELYCALLEVFFSLLLCLGCGLYVYKAN